MLRRLFGRNGRVRRAREVFERLEQQLDPRFEEAYWTGLTGGDDSSGLRYDVSYREQRHLRWLAYVVERLREAPPGTKLLDVGSNVYWLVGAAASHLDLTVVDVRAHPLAGVLPFRFVEASVVELPFDDGAFDVVSAPQLLHHIGLTFGQVVRADAYQAGLGELIRVLRPGGQIVLCTWVKAGRSCVGPARPRIFGLAHLRHLLAERGLEVVDWHLVSRESCREIDEGQLRDATELPADWALITLRKAP